MSLNDNTDDFLVADKPENGLISEVNYPCEQKELHKSKFEKWNELFVFIINDIRIN